jgi:hypothetical protein
METINDLVDAGSSRQWNYFVSFICNALDGQQLPGNMMIEGRTEPLRTMAELNSIRDGIAAQYRLALTAATGAVEGAIDESIFQNDRVIITNLVLMHE